MCKISSRTQQRFVSISLVPANFLNSFVKQRGIDVMAEIDTPGHASVISKAFPEHIACPEATPWSLFANGFCSSLLSFV